METVPLRSLFGVSSPRTEARGVVPQPEVPTENIFYEIPSGMLEKLLANPFTGDGSSHPDLHLWPLFFGGLLWPLLFPHMGQCSINDDHHTYNSKLRATMTLYGMPSVVYRGNDLA